MLNNPLTHGLWEQTAPEAPVTPALDKAVIADVVIVGAGYTGLSAALHLAEAGKKVVVVEAVEVGYGGAGRNVGLINGGMWTMPQELPDVLGPIYGERLLNLLGDAPLYVRTLIQKHGIECELETNGTLHLAVGESGLKEIEERQRQWSARGAPVKVLSAEETAKRVGSTAYAGSLHDPRAGTLQPLAYARGLARIAIAAGVSIHTKSAATGLAYEGGRWTVKTDRGSVTAPWLVFSTDAYSTGPFEKIRKEQVYLPYFNFATKPLTPSQLETVLPGREGCWDTVEVLSSFRMDKAGRLVFGSVGALRNTGHAVHREWSKRSVKKLFPQIGDVEFEAEWFGWIGMSDDALPRFHKFGPKAVGFSAYNGRGIAPGTIFGKTLAEHVLGQIAEADLPLPLTDVRLPAFRPLKEAYYEAGAQIAHFAGARF
ncbi:NAD(P)/FAD-dependent oxidoreductase [Allorhizobium borbori]|uniref:Glycine/D-amino acid oxidase-like deaminating enzyme n=1 Tax=Allorhizobium borbori TaxID=485907 RepID=A0A7W6K335_9HYPH|nr:FAD-binding oxidoreductase [Allorhizobium borbori]MBB4104217.1 glycine/D-amino acid oxidase-like deaminating enzyme [Allorhizobium borbori]